jgi:photosystem II stability/assembly factor-like uncharacterized protein
MAKQTPHTHATSDATEPTSRTGDLEPQNKLEPGPRKERPNDRPGPRLGNHKVRTVWFQARAAWPVREAHVQSLVDARRHAAGAKAASAKSQWESIGPSNIGGRVTSLACDPGDPDRVWAGTAGGGVWFSADAGKSWASQWHNEDTLNIGALGIDPSDTDVIYAGTGEANLSADSYAGVGLYRSADGGKVWQHWAKAGVETLPRRIGVVAIDPHDSKHILLGGVGFKEVSSDNDLGGLYTSTDAGRTWARQSFISTNNYWCHALVFHPTKRGVVFATITARGPRSGIYRSSDGGATWKQLQKGLPRPERFGRTSLALCASKPNRIYAIASDMKSDSSDMMLGVFRSDNGGRTWTDVTGKHFRNEGQMSYGNTIAVDPRDPNVVLCGGVDLHRTDDGGRTWKRASKWDAKRGTKSYAHADHHCLLMPKNARGRVYDANDGGMDLSEDGGLHWTNRSVGIGATMFYDADIAQSDIDVYGGGAQDNGTVVTKNGKPDAFEELLDGDGGWITYDPNDATRVFASYYNLNIYRFQKGRRKDVSPPKATEKEKNAVWMAFILLDPSNSRVIYTGSYRVWRSRNGGNHWTDISASLDGSTISCIEVAKSDPTRIYVGTENGSIFRSTDHGKTWSANLSGPTLPGHIVTRLVADPTNEDRVYASVGNFGHSHVFRSDDGGLDWSDIDKGALPNAPHSAIAISSSDPKTVYVGTDVGVFVSRDAGATWANLSGNLPHVPVVDLVVHEKSKTLMAATYGRSLWRRPLL